MNDTKRILVVDDEPANQRLLVAMLGSLGYDSDVAADGPEALAKFKQGFDLVLLDVMMPGMDGFEVVRRMREDPDCGDIPIVMVTILTSKHARLDAAEAGANDFIGKPLDKVELRVRVASLLKMKEDRDALKRERAQLELACEKRTEEIRDLLETSAKIVQYMPAGLMVFQYQAPAELFLVDSNPEAVRLTGVDLKDCRGLELDEIWPTAWQQGLTQAMLKTMETGTIFESAEAYFKKDESNRSFLVRAFPMPGNLLGVALEDVTEIAGAACDTQKPRTDPARRIPRDVSSPPAVEDKLPKEATGPTRGEELPAKSRELSAMGEKLEEATAKFDRLFDEVAGTAQSALACLDPGQPSTVNKLIQQIVDTAQRGKRLAAYVQGATSEP